MTKGSIHVLKDDFIDCLIDHQLHVGEHFITKNSDSVIAHCDMTYVEPQENLPEIWICTNYCFGILDLYRQFSFNDEAFLAQFNYRLEKISPRHFSEPVPRFIVPLNFSGNRHRLSTWNSSKRFDYTRLRLQAEAENMENSILNNSDLGHLRSVLSNVLRRFIDFLTHHVILLYWCHIV